MHSIMTKTISIVTPCYNEEENIEELYNRVVHTMEQLPYKFELIVIDNCSTDNSVAILKEIARKDRRVKLIINARNFGWIKSPYHGLLQATGDACVMIASDLQDPPEMIPEFVQKWEEGFKIVMAVKPESEESSTMFFLRRMYYQTLSKISEIPLINNSTGAGLFDKKVIEILRSIKDPYPYFRGLLCEIGFPIATVPFKQPRRMRGVSKHNFFNLYDVAMLGITNHSKMPLRLMTMFGFAMSIFSLFVAIVFFVAKLIFWNSFQLGMAPILVGFFMFSAIQMTFIGLLGEYIGSIQTQVRNLPHVIEAERVNFDRDDNPDAS